ncbi:GntR family transcriptional regulator [Nonomuraea angiospora]|uniref:DNA-binding GntR family transcriptional regulator n=1 Tax=Nonomuraea angiospora TaxID=46172 RepID=A0ABR9MCP8_9ACTN|nr:UTRA domain-containing protein [Nonomuraea angiospora]MBE1590126.1 DNA-binding GntR family transcriptional regulator [Nonomuraea angiospora]
MLVVLFVLMEEHMPDTGWASVSTPYVRPRRPGEADAWTEEAAAHGHVGTNRLRGVEEASPPREVAEVLDLGPEGTAVIRRRLVLLDGRPTELADSYYPASIARGTRLAEERKIPGGALTALAELGHRPHTAEESVTARPSTKPEQDALDIQPEDWVMVLTRVLRTDTGMPIEATVMTMVADGRELRYRMIINEEI